MSGLVAYGSSDEEEDDQIAEAHAIEKAPQNATVSSSLGNGLKSNPDPKSKSIQDPDPPSITFQAVESEGPLVGPAMGPALGPTDEIDSYVASPSAGEDLSAPLSPYSANRALIHQLTVPALPSLDIPPSPPGEPAAGITAKFSHFLELKKKGVHFNEKLANSSALKNPSLMEKLMDFADIDEVGQFSNTLPKEFWNPGNFPEWAYKEKLAKTQQTILKKREEEKTRGQRESVDFVPATASGDSSRSGTPGAVGVRSGPKSAAERVMAGLERGKPNSSSVQAGVKRKTRFES